MRLAGKYLIVIVVAVVSFFTVVGCQRGSIDKNTVSIAINQYVNHPNLDAVYGGFKEVVDKWARSKGKTVNYRLQNAQGDLSIAMQIARQQVAERPNVILALATPSAQVSLKATSEIPVIFGAITDPVAAGLVNSLSEPGRNATGTSDLGPYEKQFELIKNLLPNSKNVGIIRNPGEANSVASMKIIDKAIEKFGFKKVEASVASTSEVLLAAKSLIGRCDFFYMPADNTVLSALDAVVSVARAEKIPLFVGDEGSVKMGGIATIGINYYELGKLTGEIAIRVLEGEQPKSIPVVVGKATELIINPVAAKSQGMRLPEDILKSARRIE